MRQSVYIIMRESVYLIMRGSVYLCVPSPPMTYNCDISYFCKNLKIISISNPPLDEARTVPN